MDNLLNLKSNRDLSAKALRKALVPVIGICTDSIALLAHTNQHLEQHRRDSIVFSLDKSFRQLAKNFPTESIELFGDDLPKRLTTIIANRKLLSHSSTSTVTKKLQSVPTTPRVLPTGGGGGGGGVEAKIWKSALSQAAKQIPKTENQGCSEERLEETKRCIQTKVSIQEKYHLFHYVKTYAGGNIQAFIHNWEKCTSDLSILDTVRVGLKRSLYKRNHNFTLRHRQKHRLLDQKWQSFITKKL